MTKGIGDMYILKRTNQHGGYVANPGSKNSYTRNVLKARRYPTRALAEADRCPENEIILNFQELLR